MGAANYPHTLIVNLELDEAFQTIFADTLKPIDIIRRMETYFGTEITPEGTLIFLDEIQLCERAMTALKYFYEEEPEYHVIGAGSLLGVTLGRTRSAFPVGKVRLTEMFPMDFREYLWATGNVYLDEQITAAFMEMAGLSDVLHQKALGLLNQYLLTRGMPASVAAALQETLRFRPGHPALHPRRLYRRCREICERNAGRADSRLL